MTLPLEVGIGCHHLASMRDFYENTLGLQFVSEARAPEQTAQAYRLARTAATVVRLQTPRGERIKLIAPEGAPAPPPEPAAYVFDQANVMYLTFIISDIHAQVRRLHAAGIRCMTGDAPVLSRPGLYVAFLRDPEGNVVELVQYDDVAAYRPDLA
jgi:lactoylglutathione lyase